LDNPDDLRHIQRYFDRNIPCITVIGVHDAEHSAAMQLKREGALAPFLEALLAGNENEALDVLMNVRHRVLATAGVPPPADLVAFAVTEAL